jgi:hypothetical protein
MGEDTGRYESKNSFVKPFMFPHLPVEQTFQA